MKKCLFYSAVFVLVAAGFASCKKDYVCNCTINIPLADTSFSIKINQNDQKKKEAENECEGAQNAYEAFAGGLLGTVDCELEKK